ncbi:hypothetical protein GGH19_002460 [Coemansia sp. RSA 1807]|nr:hypothetical protein LPJ58_000023 [Coemansia sp. RSA 1591]KAJ1768386.1 hypothetical protein LPJ69_000054 [Coemansia sp. RSA 1752]KAJ1789701.1 hypothetical protein LPJ62_002303 [Coemansia sp. RSA 2167]KAJ1795405.1 hypothetical protein LPJ67_000024 [Coemansia sp. RSA 1938]KAJ2133121.1 hypothetical protein GGF48_000415 [Coemansia sp. RSA 921]KAJ2134014.1 hypothetical protein GGH17_002997 [Coemansia sp. RSA 788]KAJ2145694.1 hypothetical protein IW142_002460 [Coemansia sp. RSA 564]KAJ2151664.1
MTSETAHMEIDQTPPIPPTLKTTISKQPYYYFAITLATSTPAAPIDVTQYHGYITLVLTQWLGAIGGGIPVDILDYSYPRATIRVPHVNHKQVWQAMTVNPFSLLSDNTQAYFQVVRNSAFAMGVVTSSRKSL